MGIHYEWLNAKETTVGTVTKGHTPDGEPVEIDPEFGIEMEGTVTEPLALVLDANDCTVIEGTVAEVQALIDRQQNALNDHRAPRVIVDDMVKKLGTTLDAHVPETTAHYAVEVLRSAIRHFMSVAAGPDARRPVNYNETEPPEDAVIVFGVDAGRYSIHPTPRGLAVRRLSDRATVGIVDTADKTDAEAMQEAYTLIPGVRACRHCGEPCTEPGMGNQWEGAREGGEAYEECAANPGEDGGHRPLSPKLLDVEDALNAAGDLFLYGRDRDLPDGYAAMDAAARQKIRDGITNGGGPEEVTYGDVSIHYDGLMYAALKASTAEATR